MNMLSGKRCFEYHLVVIILLAFSILINDTGGTDHDEKTCPKVKGIKNFVISEFLGSWYIVNYYASSEEALAYRCMRADLSISPEIAEVTMNFTYSFTDDPINELLAGNITWKIPILESPAHWIHAEYPYEGIYNTYILDTDYKSWGLLMHCAEKSKSLRYLSSFIMSREKTLGVNVISYLREKLPRYDIDLEYMFPMEQKNCNETNISDPGLFHPFIVDATTRKNNTVRKHPLKRKHIKRSHH